MGEKCKVIRETFFETNKKRKQHEQVQHTNAKERREATRRRLEWSWKVSSLVSERTRTYVAATVTYRKVRSEHSLSVIMVAPRFERIHFHSNPQRISHSIKSG